MTDHQATLEQWHAALAKALEDRAINAIPGILVRMARDGWGHEAETARRMLTQPPPSLGELAGHDREAARQLSIIAEAYRMGGLPMLRDVVTKIAERLPSEAVQAILIEAVLTHAEHGPGARRAAAEAAADRAEAADEAAAVRRGGGR